jgi:hypothetical protein
MLLFIQSIFCFYAEKCMQVCFFTFHAMKLNLLKEGLAVQLALFVFHSCVIILIIDEI